MIKKKKKQVYQKALNDQRGRGVDQTKKISYLGKTYIIYATIRGIEPSLLGL